MFCFHRWVYRDKTEVDDFMGQPVNRSYKHMRNCTKCRKVQEFQDDSQGGGWHTLNDEHRAIYFSVIDAAMHKETAMLLELERHLAWCLKHAARIDGENLVWGRPSIYAMSHHVPIVDGDVESAIEAAMERK